MHLQVKISISDCSTQYHKNLTSKYVKTPYHFRETIKKKKKKSQIYFILIHYLPSKLFLHSQFNNKNAYVKITGIDNFITTA